ncbi:MAG: M23 family metallopeptidase [Deltaproteobacteria bacterium]|jgi:hypothetical protein|nr:M23 family metallopeptidase [Deltaproteobacteria bacterium]
MNFLVRKLYLFLGVVLSLTLFTCGLWASSASCAENFVVLHPQELPIGDPFVLKFTGEFHSGDLQARWLKHKVPLKSFGSAKENGDVYACILAVPLECIDKTLPLQIVLLQSGQPEKILYSASINIVQREFTGHELSVEPKQANPAEKDLERINQEAKKNRQILSGISGARYWSIPLTRPVPGIITSEFGDKRIFNGQLRRQHKGADFRGAEGSAVKTCADGRVVLAENQYFAGNFVIIDHGLGVFSTYAHLSAFKVKTGDRVKTGQLIGLVGKTGRVTGPHLHFGLAVLGSMANPEPLIPDFRKK